MTEILFCQRGLLLLSIRGNRTLSSFGGMYLILYSNLFKTVAIQNVLGRYKYSLNSFLYLQTNQMKNKYPVCFLSLKLFQDLTFQLTWDFVDFSDEQAANNVSWACLWIQIKLADRFFLSEFSLNLKLPFYYRTENPERKNNFSH